MPEAIPDSMVRSGNRWNMATETHCGLHIDEVCTILIFASFEQLDNHIVVEAINLHLFEGRAREAQQMLTCFGCCWNQ
jgi:hypothetical protein